MPWLRSSANKVQTNVFCCCLIVNYGVALHRTCYTIVCSNRRGIFLSFAGSPRDFFGSWLFAPFDHPRHLKSRVPPWARQSAFIRHRGNETLTVMPIPTLRPTSTLALLRQWLYRTSEAPLNYRTFTSTLQYGRSTRNGDHFTRTTLLMSWAKTNWRTDREQYTTT